MDLTRFHFNHKMDSCFIHLFIVGNNSCGFYRSVNVVHSLSNGILVANLDMKENIRKVMINSYSELFHVFVKWYHCGAT